MEGKQQEMSEEDWKFKQVINLYIRGKHNVKEYFLWISLQFLGLWKNTMMEKVWKRIPTLEEKVLNNEKGDRILIRTVR